MKNTCFDASFAFKQCMHTALVNRMQKSSKQWNILQNEEDVDKAWQSTSGDSIVDLSIIYILY